MMLNETRAERVAGLLNDPLPFVPQIISGVRLGSYNLRNNHHGGLTIKRGCFNPKLPIAETLIREIEETVDRLSPAIDGICIVGLNLLAMSKEMGIRWNLPVVMADQKLEEEALYGTIELEHTISHGLILLDTSRRPVEIPAAIKRFSEGSIKTSSVISITEAVFPDALRIMKLLGVDYQALTTFRDIINYPNFEDMHPGYTKKEVMDWLIRTFKRDSLV